MTFICCAYTIGQQSTFYYDKFYFVRVPFFATKNCGIGHFQKHIYHQGIVLAQLSKQSLWGGSQF